MKRKNMVRLKMLAIFAVLYFAGILVPLGAFIWAIQKDLVLQAWSTGNLVLVAAAVVVAFTLGIGFWVKRIAKRI